MPRPMLAAVAVLFLAACGGDGAPATTDASTSTSAGNTVPAPTTTGGAAGITVTVSNFAFAPATVTMALGGTVTFTVTEGGHTSTSRDGAWASGGLSEGASFAFTPPAPGTYEFFCEFHPSMQGTLTVTG